MLCKKQTVKENDKLASLASAVLGDYIGTFNIHINM